METLYYGSLPPHTTGHSHWPHFTSEALTHSAPQGTSHFPGNPENANEICLWDSFEHRPYRNEFFYDTPYLVSDGYSEADYRTVASIQHISDHSGVLLGDFNNSSRGSMAPPAEMLVPPVSTEDRFYMEPMQSFESLLSPRTDVIPPTLIRPAILLPDQRSTYSELSANLAYLSSLSEATSKTSRDESQPANRQRDLEKGRAVPEDKSHGGVVRLAHASEGALLSEIDWPSREKPARKHLAASGTRSSIKQSGRALTSKSKGTPPKRIPPPYGIGKSSGSSSPTGKKLGLACLFCRERKIACGRPSESNPDQTCNQCARRLFKCEYPTESRRGQHKRSKNKLEIT